MIWWKLKTYLGKMAVSEYAVRVMRLVTFYCIVMQATWCLKF